MDESQIEKKRVILRDMIINEETLIDHRLTWLIQIQAFIFAAVFAVQYFPLDLKGTIPWLTTLLSILGGVSSLLAMAALIGATQAMREIDANWRKTRPEIYDGPGIFGLDPEFTKYEGIFKGKLPYLSSENMLAFMFSLAWIVVALRYFLIESLVIMGAVAIAISLFYYLRHEKNQDLDKSNNPLEIESAVQEEIDI